MPGAVENVGEALALTGHIVELSTFLEGVDRNASSVDLRDEYPAGGSGSLCARSTRAKGKTTLDQRASLD